MATSAKTAVFKFQDGETYSLTLSPFNPNNTNSFKANVKQFNANIGSNAYSDTFVSEAGAPVIGIESAKIVTTEKTYFYQRGAE